MRLDLRLLLACGIVFSCLTGFASDNRAANDAGFTFAVSGDSRNCGDIVMPAIAADVARHNAAFYWHLGDLRAIYDFDADVMKRATGKRPANIIDYVNNAWQDAIDNQFAAFGSTPVFVGIGNHETIPPKTRDQFIIQFADWLDRPELQQQRLKDNPTDHKLKTYYHGVRNGVDFVYLDNSTPDQFDSAQLAWLNGVLARDANASDVKTLVVGLHEALPDSLASSHSMNNSATGEQTGRQVYKSLLKWRETSKKPVYVLASHSHFFMSNVYNSESWRSNGGVLPGWIVGTAGAFRYALPDTAKQADEAKTNVYGYLLGTVKPDGTIQFAFQQIDEDAIPAQVKTRFGNDLVHDCFVNNRETPAPAH